jgi:glucose/arabinose dehydrogenase
MRSGIWILLSLFTLGATAGAAPAPQVQLRKFAEGFTQPVALEFMPGQAGALVVEQAGRIRRLQVGSKDHPVVLDLTDRVEAGGEMGLLGIALHPQFATNRRFFVNYTTKRDGQLGSRISEFRLPADTLLADPAAERILLRYPQPYRNHNGGMVLFGPDGFLYIGTGDGGAANDPHDHGQNLGSLLGKMLRVDVDRTPEGALYGIPADNPFLHEPGARPEIYAYGLRNPWRYSFDRATGELWCGDVGQNAREEIDLIIKGGNYGWRIMEGTICTPKIGDPCDREGLLPPVVDYPRPEGVSVTGGYVYRGARFPALQGVYLYADFASGHLWGLRHADGKLIENHKLISKGPSLSSFAEDHEGELYGVGYQGALYRVEATP